mmetsp:Transcript_103291/g.267090  ORF Transcript_103291/g.267090 Transcript_103291/m.267090 type:complete len:200 (+) Transcript_103291:590-1189(+)
MALPTALGLLMDRPLGEMRAAPLSLLGLTRAERAVAALPVGLTRSSRLSSCIWPVMAPSGVTCSGVLRTVVPSGVLRTVPSGEPATELGVESSDMRWATFGAAQVLPLRVPRWQRSTSPPPLLSSSEFSPSRSSSLVVAMAVDRVTLLRPVAWSPTLIFTRVLRRMGALCRSSGACGAASFTTNAVRAVWDIARRSFLW